MGYNAHPTSRTRAEPLVPAAGHAPARSAAMQGCSTSNEGGQKNRAAAVQSYGGRAAAQQGQAARTAADNRDAQQAIATQAQEGPRSAGYEPTTAAVMQNHTDVQVFWQAGRAPAPARAAATYGEYRARVATQGEPMQAALKQAPGGEATINAQQVVNHVVHQQSQQKGHGNHMYYQSSQTGSKSATYQQEVTSSAVRGVGRTMHTQNDASSTRQNQREDSTRRQSYGADTYGDQQTGRQ